MRARLQRYSLARLSIAHRLAYDFAATCNLRFRKCTVCPHFPTDTLADPSSHTRDAIEFWDLTNRQDWEIVEWSQRGVSSRRYGTGPYSARESVPAAWDREYLRQMGRG